MGKSTSFWPYAAIILGTIGVSILLVHASPEVPQEEGGVVRQLQSIVDIISSFFSSILSFFSQNFGSIPSFFTQIFGSIFSFFAQIFGSIGQAPIPILTYISGLFSAAINFVLCSALSFFDICPDSTPTITTTTAPSPPNLACGNIDGTEESCTIFGENVELGCSIPKTFQFRWSISTDAVCESGGINETAVEEAMVQYFAYALDDCGTCSTSNITIDWTYLTSFADECLQFANAPTDGSRRIQTTLSGVSGGTCYGNGSEFGSCPTPGQTINLPQATSRFLEPLDTPKFPSDDLKRRQMQSANCEVSCVESCSEPSNSLACFLQANDVCGVTAIFSDLALEVDDCATGSDSCNSGLCCGTNDCPCTLDSGLSQGQCLFNDCDLVSACSPESSSLPLSLCCIQGSGGDFLFEGCASSPACMCRADDSACEDNQETCSDLNVCTEAPTNSEACAVCNSLVDIVPAETDTESVYDFEISLDNGVCLNRTNPAFIFDIESVLTEYIEFEFNVCGECGGRVNIQWVNFDGSSLLCPDEGDRRRRLGSGKGAYAGSCTGCGGAELSPDGRRRGRRLELGANKGRGGKRTYSRLRGLASAADTECSIDLCDTGGLLDCFLRQNSFVTSGESGALIQQELDCSPGSEECENGACCPINNCTCSVITEPSQSMCVSQNCDLPSVCTFPGDDAGNLCCEESSPGVFAFPECQSSSACRCVADSCSNIFLGCQNFDVCNTETCDAICDGVIDFDIRSEETEYQAEFNITTTPSECAASSLEQNILSFFQTAIEDCAQCSTFLTADWIRFSNLEECAASGESSFALLGDVGGSCDNGCVAPSKPFFLDTISLASEQCVLTGLVDIVPSGSPLPITRVKNCTQDSMECFDGSCSYTNACPITNTSEGVSQTLCDAFACDVPRGFYNVSGGEGLFVNLCCEYDRSIPSKPAVYESCGGNGGSMQPTEVCQCWNKFFTTLESSLALPDACKCTFNDIQCCDLDLRSCPSDSCADCLFPEE